MRLGRRGRSRAGAPLSKRALLQHVNREVWTLAVDDAPVELYCECGLDDCILSIDVPREDFAAARAHPASAIVVPEHRRRHEPLLERFASFVVVTDGEAGGDRRDPPPRVGAEASTSVDASEPSTRVDGSD
jgi:hypothetical protein